MPSLIHKTAIIDQSATIGEDVSIGAYSTVGPGVTIGDNCYIGARAGVRYTKMGEGCVIGDNSLIGGDPQIYDWRPVDSFVELGAGTVVNELSVVHRSMREGGATTTGERCYIMAQVHVGHDCKLGNEVTVTTLAGLSGHVTADDFAVIGGAAGIHQHVRVGTMAMVGGMTRLVQDVPPYFMVVGSPAKAHGLNAFALKKRGVAPAERLLLRKAYRILTKKEPKPTLPDAVKEIETQLGATGHAKTLLDFIACSKRGLTL